MKTTFVFTCIALLICIPADTKLPDFRKSKVSYSDFETLVRQVKKHRKKRLIDFNEFLAKSKEENTIILDTRSKDMYDKKHIKGAIHLNFSDFTQENLAKIIPNWNTKILIYCNNNFEGDRIHFASKVALPKLSLKLKEKEEARALTLALNIPTYINLYGYGYENVYELSELIYPLDDRITYEGLAVPKEDK
ncbi:rhodanese-like domain-containing protein [uncultured Psychroserpens sp.]|uniref:rhodanese-like domain-containing protein n=1 Tax=uncultured Psychroserpens sp. TaxID=255436 RepID=UPI00263619AB|nr:rhodanese-like domain-containing protein [uncultured Psychroserpens sp.]